MLTETVQRTGEPGSGLGKPPLQQRRLHARAPGAEVHPAPQAAGPHQSGSALGHGGRAGARRNPRRRGAADRRREDAAQPDGEGPRHRGSAGRSVRPGPARAAAARSHHLGHPGHHAAPGVRRARRKTVSHAGRVQGRRPPAAHHRKNRVARGPARGRIVAAGGRPPARWIARQRRHSAGGRGRTAALHPPFRHATRCRAKTWSRNWP